MVRDETKLLVFGVAFIIVGASHNLIGNLTMPKTEGVLYGLLTAVAGIVMGLSKPRDVKKETARKFGFVIAIGGLLIFALSFYGSSMGVLGLVLVVMGALLLVMGALAYRRGYEEAHTNLNGK
ncbi:MAG: hypothetical protein AB1476_05690 [Candidatus Hadarchaeota archaeon]